jgi:hypothetical protein
LPRYRPSSDRKELTYGTLTQSQALQLLDGLDWHACNDIFFKKRTPEWLEELLHCTIMVAMQCFHLAVNHTDMLTLDAPEFRKETIFVKSKELKVREAHVNYEFLYTVEIRLSNLWRYTFNLVMETAPLLHEQGHIPECIPRLDSLKSLLNFAARRAQQLRELDVCEFRFKYVDKLQLSWGDIRWSKLFAGELNEASAPREFLQRAKRGRPYRMHCGTKEHILQGHIHLKPEVNRLAALPETWGENYGVHEVLSSDAMVLLYSKCNRSGDLLGLLIEEKIFTYQRILQAWVFDPKDNQPPIWSCSLAALFTKVRIEHPARLKAAFTTLPINILDTELNLADDGDDYETEVY